MMIRGVTGRPSPRRRSFAPSPLQDYGPISKEMSLPAVIVQWVWPKNFCSSGVSLHVGAGGKVLSCRRSMGLRAR